MKILIVSPWLPYPLTHGGAVRIYSLMRHLSRRHEVSLLCFDDRSSAHDVQTVRQVCTRLELIPGGPSHRSLLQHARHVFSPMPFSVCMPSRAMEARLKDLLREERYDLVQIEFLALAHLARHLPPGRRVLVEHSVTSIVRQRMIPLIRFSPKRLYYRWDLVKLVPYEKRLLREFDLCIAVSDHDRAILQRMVPRLPVAIVPNGVDCEYFAPGPAPADRELLFIGAFHAEQANVDAAVHLARDILPLIRRRVPDVRLWVVGPNPPAEVRALAGDGIAVTGYVEDVRPFIARASTVILPLRGGAGTKIRVFSAMAMARPVITTPVVVEGMDVTNGRQCIVAGRTEDLAAAAVALLTDPREGSRIGAEARRWVQAHSDWQLVAGRLEAAYDQLLRRAHHQATDADATPVNAESV